MSALASAMVGASPLDPLFALLSPDDRMEQARSELAILDQTCKEPEAAIVGLRDQIVAKLQKFGLAEKAEVQICQHWIHPWNRSGTGCEPAEPLSKLDKLAKSGVRMSELDRALGIGRVPGDRGMI